MEIDYKRIVAVILVVLLAALSFFVFGELASDPAHNADIIDSIDEKCKTVLALTGTVGVASAVISAIPDDTCTPIAQELAELTDDFLIILVIMLAEKYLLSILGLSSFKIIIPMACALLIIGIISRGRGVKKLAYKVGVFGLAIFFAIPLSIRASDAVYDAYKENIDQTIVAAEQFDMEAETDGTTGSGGFLDSLISNVVTKAKDLAKKPAELLTNYVESLAILIVTSCVIPIVVLIFFFWLLKIVIGVDIPMPIPAKPIKHMKGAIEHTVTPQM